MNSTGVGTVGRTNLFDLEQDCVVDSHISIIRLDNKKILPRYALYCLMYLVGFDEIEKMAEGASGQIELEPKKIENIQLPIIDKLQQQKVLDLIDPLERRIEEAKNSLRNTLSLKQIIIKKYLS
jgi:type I restriction enzyme S subunit